MSPWIIDALLATLANGLIVSILFLIRMRFLRDGREKRRWWDVVWRVFAGVGLFTIPVVLMSGEPIFAFGFFWGCIAVIGGVFPPPLMFLVEKVMYRSKINMGE